MIKNKDQLITIDKLTKNKIKVIPKDNAFFYYKIENNNQTSYCFDKETNDKTFLKEELQWHFKKHITVDNKNRTHSYNHKIPVIILENNQEVEVYFDHGLLAIF
jgi:hypothetical protein